MYPGLVINQPPSQVKVEVVRARVLVVEDGVARLRPGLEVEGYRVDVAADAEALFHLAKLQPYDAILLDLTSSSLEGLVTVTELRRREVTAPLVVVSDRTSVEDRVLGLDSGADDYLPKPFPMPELLARLRALLRRQQSRSSNVLRVGDLELDRISRWARRGGERIELSRLEFKLLELLMSESPQPVGKAAIIERVWGKRLDPRSNVVNVYLNSLRRKLHREHLSPLLHTIRGVGFSCRGMS